MTNYSRSKSPWKTTYLLYGRFIIDPSPLQFWSLTVQKLPTRWKNSFVIARRCSILLEHHPSRPFKSVGYKSGSYKDAKKSYNFMHKLRFRVGLGGVASQNIPKSSFIEHPYISRRTLIYNELWRTVAQMHLHDSWLLQALQLIWKTWYQHSWKCWWVKQNICRATLKLLIYYIIFSTQMTLDVPI